jgi:hypothetical protein
MGRARYLLAIAVGLAIGAAAGWVTGRANHAAPPAAVRHHRAQLVNERPTRRHANRARPAPQPPAGPPTMRELQQQVLACLLDHAAPADQTSCLRAVMRDELRMARRFWGAPEGGSPALPFASLT